MKIFDESLELIEKGIQGGNKGIPHGLNRLSYYIPGLQPGTYYLIAAESGVGKTAFADEMFAYRAFDYVNSLGDNSLNFKVLYYSLEIDKRIKIIKGICRRIYLKYGLITDVNYVLSRGKFRISGEIYEKVLETADYFEKFEDHVIIKDVAINPTGIAKDVAKFAEENGKLTKVNGRTNYKPNAENEIVFIIVDHVGLCKKERGFDNKQTIDKLSEYMVPIRNIYGYSPVIIQQFNRSISSTDRFKLHQVTPQPSDLKQTGNTYEDCSTCLALFSPKRYDIPTFRNYDITRLQDRFRSLSIIKNRDGEADKIIGLNFIGEIGYFSELKKAQEMTNDDYIFATSHFKADQDEEINLNIDI